MEALIYSANNSLKALPKLVEAIWQKGNRIVIYSSDKQRLEGFDNLLWSYEQLSFVPHVIEGDDLCDKTPVVLVSSEVNPNNANVLVCLDVESIPKFCSTFEKVVYMYNIAENSSKEVAALIESLKLHSSGVIHYQQSQNGAWQKAC